MLQIKAKNIQQTVCPVETGLKTPNVPRAHHSFFNRKYRDITDHPQLTPATPKLTKTPTRSRRRSSASGSAFHPYKQDRSGGSGGSKKGSAELNTDSRRSSHQPSNELLDPCFSTPKTTKTTLLTPSTSGARLQNGRLVQLVYKPLELDNDSSSESADGFMKRRNAIKAATETENSGSQETETKTKSPSPQPQPLPLPIECQPSTLQWTSLALKSLRSN